MWNLRQPWSWFVHRTNAIGYIPVGANNNLALLDRTTGATRVLSTTPDNKSGASFTPDGKTVIFVRSHDVRRIAVVDLTKMLAGGAHN